VKSRAREDNLPFNVFMNELKADTENDFPKKVNWCFSTTGALFAVPFAYIVATKILNWDHIQADCDLIFVDLEAARELLAENESKLKE
jgi:hypothetical protein